MFDYTCGICKGYITANGIKVQDRYYHIDCVRQNNVFELHPEIDEDVIYDLLDSNAYEDVLAQLENS